MANGDVDGGTVRAGAEDEADELGTVAEINGRAGARGRDGLFTDQAALGDADGGYVQEEAKVAGDAEAAGVGIAVAVDEEEVRHLAEAAEGAGQDWHLPEGQEAGDVGECDGGLDDLVLDDGEVGIGEEDDGGSSEGGPASDGPVDEGDVGAGDEAGVGGPAFGDDAGGQADLDGDGLSGGDVPGMEAAQLHGPNTTAARTIEPENQQTQVEPYLMPVSYWMVMSRKLPGGTVTVWGVGAGKGRAGSGGWGSR